MIARFKLKGLDGNLNARWSMLFNSKVRAKSYQALVFLGIKYVFKIAWLYSVRVLRCEVYSFLTDVTLIFKRNFYFLKKKIYAK